MMKRIKFASASTILYLLLLWFTSQALGANISIVSNGSPASVILIGERASEEEKFAAKDLNNLLERLTRVRLQDGIEKRLSPKNSAILLGTPATSSLISDFEVAGLISISNANLGAEGYILKTTLFNGIDYIIIAASKPKGVIYGAYTLVEAFISAITKLSPVDLDFQVSQTSNLSISELNLKDSPFYPIRAALSKEDPAWLSRHRINMSGAEGVWSGTGNDDGIGTAFKYVDSPEFEDMQDEPRSVRVARIAELNRRFDELKKGGIESYLFMYVTGEPTEALIANHPELLGPKVEYGASRNQKFYYPFCWSKPEVRGLIRRLTREIVKTYPALSGFHLRSWGAETRACNCPQCGDRSPVGQSRLWNIYFDIISAAREIRPDFKFYLSNYDKTWLLDPDKSMLKKLPAETIISQKWGIDGEPTPNPLIDGNLINLIGSDGKKMIILSHDTEEVMPFWMVEGDLFAEGLRKYANDAKIRSLGGFIIQGEDGFGHLDKLISAKLNWEPNLDYIALMRNYLTVVYGSSATERILKAIRINTWVLSSYFNDFAGTFSFNGDYKKGSAAFATRFWDLLGKKAVSDILAMPTLDAANYAIQRLAGLLPQQLQATNEMTFAQDVIRAPNIADSRYQDAVHLMRIWVDLFESRMRLTEAVKLGFEAADEGQIKSRLAAAAEYSKQLILEVKAFREYSNVFDYTPEVARQSLIKLLNEEVEFLQNYEAKTLIKPETSPGSERQKPFAISQWFNHPNPLEDHTTFIYTLTQNADDVSLVIYTLSGRQLATIKHASSKKGYNEEEWDGRDNFGNRLANGTYFCRIIAKLGDKRSERIGKLAVIR